MKKISRILITGGDGVVGSYMRIGVRLLRSDFDITNLSEVEKVILREKPSVIIHLAALTDIKKCEDSPDLAYRVNAIGTYNVALIAKEVGAKVIYISTNAVFDGKKKGAYLSTDKPKPINIYGHSKYIGELAVLGMSQKNLVVRTSWIFGGGKNRDKKFVGKIITKLLVGKKLSAVNDVYGTPTYGRDLAISLSKLATSGVSGIIHVTNSGRASRYDMTLVIKTALKSKSLISPVSLSNFGKTANTLKNERLDSDEYVMRSWQKALREYIETEWK
ncbi:MAG TPA: NAD(P)-dependent oxidoreductase [Candidatus Paceibacterota bacterium]